MLLAEDAIFMLLDATAVHNGNYLHIHKQLMPKFGQ